MATEQDKRPQAGGPPLPDDSSAIDAATDAVTGAMLDAPLEDAPPEDAPTDADAAVMQCANLFLNVRRLLFMSLGALTLTADEARDFIDRLGERSDIAQEEVERWIDELHEQHPSTLADAQRNGGSDAGIDALWGRLRVPTRRELEALSRKISALDRKLAALRGQRTPGTPPAPADSATPSEP